MHFCFLKEKYQALDMKRFFFIDYCHTSFYKRIDSTYGTFFVQEQIDNIATRSRPSSQFKEAWAERKCTYFTSRQFIFTDSVRNPGFAA